MTTEKYMTIRVDLAFVDNFRQTAQMMLDQELHHGYFHMLKEAPRIAYDGTKPPSSISFDKYLVTRQSYHKFKCHYQGITYELEL